jgi:hypothetical protein
MNKTNRFPPASRNWLTHASVELLPDKVAGDFLDSWLRDNLRPLALPDCFSEKVIASACDAAANVPSGVGQVHLLIFTLVSHPLSDQTWGFFRMLKNGEIQEDESTGNYEIAFYLYAEGYSKLD